MKFVEDVLVCFVMVLMLFAPTIFVAQAVFFFGKTLLIVCAVFSTTVSGLIVYSTIESHLKK